MTSKEFVVRETLKANTPDLTYTMEHSFAQVDNLLNTKGEEYSTETNRFENFLDGAASENLPPERVLWFMMLKHWLSLKKFVREISGTKRRDGSVWDEKIGDMITYLIILRTMIRKRREIEDTLDEHQVDKDEVKLDGRNEKPNKVDPAFRENPVSGLNLKRYKPGDE